MHKRASVVEMARLQQILAAGQQREHQRPCQPLAAPREQATAPAHVANAPAVNPYVSMTIRRAQVRCSAVLLAFALCAFGVRAQSVGLHLVSVHIPAREGQHNFNPGIYVRFDNGVTLGTYHNTLGKQTFYAGYTVEHGPFALTLGAASGYQRQETVTLGTMKPCTLEQAAANGGACVQQSRHTDTSSGTKAYLTPMLAPSVRLPDVLGLVPRISYIPGLAGSSNVFHLSIERALP